MEWGAYNGDWYPEAYGEEWGQSTEASTYYEYDECGWPACSACGAYAEEDSNDTDTESEGELAGNPELQAYLGSFDNCCLEGLRHEYYLARARYRHHAGNTHTQVPLSSLYPQQKGARKRKRKGTELPKYWHP